MTFEIIVENSRHLVSRCRFVQRGVAVTAVTAEKHFKNMMDQRAVLQRIDSRFAALFDTQAVLAKIHKRTLVIDVDPRRAELHLLAEQRAGQGGIGDPAGRAAGRRFDRLQGGRVLRVGCEILLERGDLGRTSAIAPHQIIKGRTAAEQMLLGRDGQRVLLCQAGNGGAQLADQLRRAEGIPL